MVNILHYLASYDPDFQAEDRKFVRKQILSTKHECDHSANVLDSSFFQCLDDTYMQHLKPAISTFGIKQDITNVKGETKVAEDLSDSEVLNTDELMEIDQRPIGKMSLDWNSSFIQYARNLCHMLEKWSAKRLEGLSQSNDAEKPKHVADIIGQIVPKIKAIIAHKPYLGSALIPAVSSPPPFFTRFWYGDLATSVANAGPGIELVSNLFCRNFVIYSYCESHSCTHAMILASFTL
jgi:hypothetical protein